MYPRFRFYIKEVREGWVEILSPTKEQALLNVLAGGFQSYGQVDCKYSRKIFERSDGNLKSVNESLDLYEKLLRKKITKSVHDIPSDWTNVTRIPVQQRLEWVRDYLMPEVREGMLKMDVDCED